MPSSSLALRARVIFPVDAPPVENGALTVTEGRIAWIGRADRAEGELIDLGDVALLPGMVNAHTHLEFSDRQKPLGKPGLPFVEWIRATLAERGRRKRSPAKAIRSGYQQSLTSGVTTVGEIVTANAPAYCTRDNSPRLTAFQEVIGFSRARADSALTAAIASLHELGHPHEDQPNDLQLGVSPHAPYTVSPPLLKSLVDLAGQRHSPVTMHVAESVAELQLLTNGTGPFRELLEERSMWDSEVLTSGSHPLDYLRLLAQAPRALVVHGNYLCDEAFCFLADHREHMSLIHCPRTHAFFEHSPLELSALLDQGVHLALGTDSRASNPDLCILREMQHVARHHPKIRPDDILKMGTLASAEALGRATQVGSLTVGKQADLVTIPTDKINDGSPQALLEEVLNSGQPVKQVWLAGALVQRPHPS
jgi:cytosine/adenosine deaminase-related metal-dependent hydrolase